jgi:hypothetical protein
MRKLALSVIGTVAALLACTGVAGAAIIGSTTEPNDSTPAGCVTGDVLAQILSDPGTPFTVPGSGGMLTQWATNALFDQAGAPITLVVLRRPTLTAETLTVVASDTETIPSPLPANRVASFTLASPIAVEGGDYLGLYSSQSEDDNAVCAWGGIGAVPNNDVIAGLTDAVAPAPGQSLPVDTSLTSPNAVLNVSATVAQTEDLGVTSFAGPPNATAQLPALFSSTVSEVGPGGAPATFVDHVPAGLTIDAVAAGLGTCTTSGQTVTCTINGLTTNQSVPVDLIVTPTAGGNYTNTVSISSPFPDPNPANNHASATLAVGTAASTQMCVVPRLGDTSSKVAGTVLKDLGCNVATTHAHSRSVHKGNVIKTTPGPGTHPFETTVRLEVSSGPKKRKHKKHRAR